MEVKDELKGGIYTMQASIFPNIQENYTFDNIQGLLFSPLIPIEIAANLIFCWSKVGV